MLSQIPTYLLAGPLGAGKTSLLQQLLLQRPKNERWAVLINEFGQVGLDGALLQGEGHSADGVTLAEIPGGCLCCINGVPFQVGLTRLLRKARPDRLWIECSGLGHPVELMQQLSAPPWQGVLALQPLIMLVNAAQLLAGPPLAKHQQQAMIDAGVIIASQADRLSSAQLIELQQRWPRAVPCRHGQLDWQKLPRAVMTKAAPAAPSQPANSIAQSSPTPPVLWRSISDWLRQEQLTNAPYSIGWRIHPQQCFSLPALQTWLKSTPWLRAKGIVHTEQGWKAFNLMPEIPADWQDSPWRRDNRLELICQQPPDVSALEQALRAAAFDQ